MLRFDSFDDLNWLIDSTRGGARKRSMTLDAYMEGTTFHAELDLPGVMPDAIEVTVEKNVLTVRAERSGSVDATEALVRERPHGTFVRRLLLGDQLDTDNVEARYENGVLHLRVPTAKSANPRKIKVFSGTDSEEIETAQAA